MHVLICPKDNGPPLPWSKAWLYYSWSTSLPYSCVVFWFATATEQTNRTRMMPCRPLIVRSTFLSTSFRGAEHTTEYVRTLGVCFLFWGRREQTIRGKCHSEETSEALLARLVEKLRLNPNNSSLDDWIDLFFTHTGSMHRP